MATRPGFHNEFDVFKYPREFHAAIRKLSENLYITRHFHPVTIGNSQYWALLARPTDEFSFYINTDREVIVLLSAYRSFEIRTLEAYEEFYSLLDSARIDRSIRFLISADDKVESIIKHYLDQYPEYPIIIPEYIDRLLSTRGNALLTAVRRNYLLRDLFGYQNPLREETFFFGRQDTVNTILDMAKSGQNSSLFGLRKSGKTSAIYAIQRKAKSFSCNVALIDCQNPSVHARSYGSLLEHIISEIRKVVGQKKIQPNLGSTPVEVSENFSQHMTSILSNIKGNILILFDEIENISPSTAASSHWRTGNQPVLFWQIIRAFVQSEHKGRVSVCIVGTSPQLLELPNIDGVANPVYLYAQKKFIPSLRFEETTEMIERLGYFMGLEFSREIISDIQKEYGGHPFFSRQVCSKIHQLSSNQRPIKVSQAALNRAKAEFGGQLESYLKDIIQNLKDNYPSEFSILVYVLSGNKENLNEFGREAPELIDHLIGYGLIDRVEDDFDIKFDAVRRALGQLVGKDGLEEKWKEMLIRRNRIEGNIRNALYHWSKMISSVKWNEVLERQLTKARLEKISGLEPQIVCARANSPLYLSDLMMILRDQDALPYLDTIRSTVVEKISTVNAIRKDAHANAVSEADMEKLRSAFDYLESQFGEP